MGNLFTNCKNYPIKKHNINVRVQNISFKNMTRLVTNVVLLK